MMAAKMIKVKRLPKHPTGIIIKAKMASSEATSLRLTLITATASEVSVEAGFIPEEMQRSLFHNLQKEAYLLGLR